MLRTAFHERALTWQMALSDLKSRSAGTALGWAWILIQPAFTLLVYVFVFSVGFKSAPVTGVPYIVWLFSGMVPWFLFSDALTGISGCVLSYAHLVKKTRFDARILPAVRALSALMVHAIFLALLYCTAAACGVTPHLSWIFCIYYSLSGLFLAWGFGVLLAALSPYVRDLQNIVALLLQVGFWATPIAYSADIMSPTIQAILRLNPLCYVVDGYRDALFYGRLPWDRLLYGALFLLLCAAVAVAGSMLYNRLRRNFADVL